MTLNFSCLKINNINKYIDTLIQSFGGTSLRTKNKMTTTKGKVMLAAGLAFGVCYYQFNNFFIPKTMHALGLSYTRCEPLGEMSLPVVALYSPLVCLAGPLWEEIAFRGVVQKGLCNKLSHYYKNKGFSDPIIHLASRVTSIFLTSLFFAAMHLQNLPLAKDSASVYLQTAVAFKAGLIMGLAKELSGGLSLPIGIHIGNNTAAWINTAQYAWLRS